MLSSTITYALIALMSVSGSTQEYVLDSDLSLTDCMATKVEMTDVPMFQAADTTLECKVEVAS